MSIIVILSIPAFVVMIALELVWWRRNRHDAQVRGYATKDTLASLSLGLGNLVINAFTKVGVLFLYMFAYEHRVFEFGNEPLAWVLLLFAEDFCYYWFHRTHHQIRFLWASHESHHSSTYFNLGTALRQPWATPFTGPWFWMPLGLLGFPPWMVLTAQAWSLLYQFWIHTESIGKLGPLEWFMNTPSHHRVHHGANTEYLDRNHAGVFIIWDRLFGTFEPERAKVVYGLTSNIDTYRPDKIAFQAFGAIAKDVARAPTLAAKAKYVLAPPGWSHDGSTLTAAQMRAKLP